MKYPKEKTPRDEAYLRFIRSQPCFLVGMSRIDPTIPDCFGEVAPHHFGKGGTSIKCSDYETVPLCVGHHSMVHSEGCSWALRGFRKAAKLYKEEWDG